MKNLEADPYLGDDNQYQEHFRKTFITEKQNADEQKDELWSLHDMMIPAGQVAKLIRIPDPTNQDFRISEVCDKLKIIESTPVIILAGAMTTRSGKTLAGIARAASRIDATILDSGVGSGIEKFCIRKKIQLFGVAPDDAVTYPRLSSEAPNDNELTNGHTHFVLLGDREAAKSDNTKQKTYKWEDESSLKFELAKRIAAGRTKKAGVAQCKMITIVVGDNPQCTQDIENSLAQNIPVVVVEGSMFSNAIKEAQQQFAEYQEDAQNSGLIKKEYQEVIDLNQMPRKLNLKQKDCIKKLVKSPKKTYICPENSEELASIIHLLLTISF